MEMGFTSVQTIAEILEGRLEPAMRDGGSYEFEDLCEEVRNAYAGLLWDIHMANLSDGDRTALESLLQTKYYEAKPGTEKILLTGAMIIDLPRDAGIYTVAAVDENKNCLKTFTKTTPAMACEPKSKLDTGPRYYRVGKYMYFPDGLPDCTAFVHVIFYGLDTADVTSEIIPRDYADKVRKKVWESLFPSKQIQADVTNNGNPNL